MPEIIELFKMILARNEITRIAHNAYQRHSYSLKRYLQNKDENIKELEKVKNRIKETQKAKLNLYNFTKKNRKRRKQLQYLLKTRQYKNATNKIEWILIEENRYSLKDMKKAIQEYEIEQILLGGK